MARSRSVRYPLSQAFSLILILSLASVMLIGAEKIQQNTNASNDMEQIASYVIFNDQGFAVAKNSSTGHFDYVSTNATHVIQNAIDTLAPTGGLILIKAGSYIIDSTIEIDHKNGIRICGESTGMPGNITYTDDNLYHGTTLHWRNGTGPLLRIYSSYNIQISDLTLYDGDREGVGIQLDGMNDPAMAHIYLQRLTIKDFDTGVQIFPSNVTYQVMGFKMSEFAIVTCYTGIEINSNNFDLNYIGKGFISAKVGILCNRIGGGNIFENIEHVSAGWEGVDFIRIDGHASNIIIRAASEGTDWATGVQQFLNLTSNAIVDGGISIESSIIDSDIVLNSPVRTSVYLKNCLLNRNITIETDARVMMVGGSVYGAIHLNSYAAYLSTQGVLFRPGSSICINGSVAFWTTQGDEDLGSMALTVIEGGYSVIDQRGNTRRVCIDHIMDPYCDTTILADASNGSISVTLPSAYRIGDVLTIKKVDGSAHDVMIVASDGALIDGSTMITIGAYLDSVSVVSDGFDWYVVR